MVNNLSGCVQNSKKYPPVFSNFRMFDKTLIQQDIKRDKEKIRKLHNNSNSHPNSLESWNSESTFDPEIR